MFDEETVDDEMKDDDRRDDSAYSYRLEGASHPSFL